MYLAPGELATFQYVSDDAVGKVSVTINAQKTNGDGAYKYEVGDGTHKTFTYRYPNQQISVTLKNKVSTWGFPFGGPISFSYTGFSAIELIVTGCLKAPFLQYGVTDESVFADDLKATNVPKAAMDIGTTVSIFTTKDIKNMASRVNDVAEFYRSAKTRSQIAVKDEFNPKTDRATFPNKFFFDDFVGCGVACTYTWENKNMNPEKSSQYMVNFGKVTSGENKDAWIMMHEMNHLHQTNWGYEGTDENSNNMLTMNEYSFQTTITAQKSVGNDGTFYTALFHPAYTNDDFLYADLQLPMFTYDSSQWAILFHSFGYERWLNYTNCCWKNVKYPANKFSAAGRHILCATEAFKTGIKEFTDINQNIGKIYDWKNFKDAFQAEYDKSPYKNNKFHPATFFYTNGFEIEGKRFTTGLPYSVNPGSTTNFDFNRAMRYFQADGNKYGKFEFSSMNGTDGRWIKKSKGVYDYISGSNISEIDDFTVDLLDVTTQKILRTYGQLKLSRAWMRNFTYEIYAYSSKTGIEVDNQPEVNYRNALKTKPMKTGKTESYYYKEGNDHFSVVHAYIVPTSTVTIQLGFEKDYPGAVYFSDEPLKNNPDDDKDKLILNSMDMIQLAYNGPVSKPLPLLSGKKYYLNILYNTYGTNRNGMNLKIKNKGDDAMKFRDLDSNWFRIEGTTDQMIKDFQWKPNLLKIFGLNKWRGKNIVSVDSSKWKFIKHPPGKYYFENKNEEGKECAKCTIEDIIFGGDYSTEFRANWWSGTKPIAQFPHDFAIDFGGMTKFSLIKLTGAGNQGYFSMNSSIEIYISNSQDDLNQSTSLIYNGSFNSMKPDIIDLGKVVEANFMLLRVLDNKNKWKSNNMGRTDLSSIEVALKKIYANKMDVLPNCKWTMKRGVGYGINGRYFVGKKGDSYEVSVPKSAIQFGFIGAKFDGMGSASVYQDGAKVATISKDSITKEDRTKLKLASKSFMQPLYLSENLTKPSKFKIAVDSGEIWLTGILTYNSGVDSLPGDDEPDNQSSKDIKSGITTGGIVGIIIAIIVLIVAAALMFYFMKKKMSKKESSNNEGITV